MRYVLILFTLTLTWGLMAAPQGSHPPLSKGEILDLLRTSTPSQVIISTINDCGIAFQPTAQIMEEFRKAGADKAVLTALRGAWHEEIPKPLGDKEIRMLLAADAPSTNIARLVRERGIDFRPTPEYLQEIQSEGAKDDLIATLRDATPRPFSKQEILQLLRARMDQGRIAQKVRIRAIDFEPGAKDLQALRTAGGQAALLDTIRTAKVARPFAPQTPAGTILGDDLVQGKAVTLICGPGDSDVPVFAEAGDLGKIATRLHCGESVTFVEKVSSPPGVDKIKYAGEKIGFVANSYLETPIATPGADVTAPSPIFKPDPPYTPGARHSGIEGVVSLWIIIDSQGNVSGIKQISEPLGSGLDESAISTVKKWKFHPATRNGAPVAVRVRVEITFRLRSNRP